MSYVVCVYDISVGCFTGGHAVALVGWGESHGMKYWVVQNSHSKEFGNHGYTHILRDENDKTPCKDAKGKSDREDCCLNELKFNMLSSVVRSPQPRAVAMLNPLVLSQSVYIPGTTSISS